MNAAHITYAWAIGLVAVFFNTAPVWAGSQQCAEHFPPREPLDTPYPDGWKVEKEYTLNQVRDDKQFTYLLETLRPKEFTRDKMWGAMGRFSVLRDGNRIYSIWGFDQPSSERGFDPPLREANGTVVFIVDSGGSHCCATIGIWSGSADLGVLWFERGEKGANSHGLNQIIQECLSR